MMKTNLRGELTDNSAREVDKFSMKNNKMIMAINNYMKSSRSAELGQISTTIQPILINSLVSMENLEQL